MSLDGYEDMPVECLNISIRSINCLRRAGIDTIIQFIETSDTDFLKIRNLGKKTLDELVSVKNDIINNKFDLLFNNEKKNSTGLCIFDNNNDLILGQTERYLSRNVNFKYLLQEQRRTIFIGY